MKNDPIVEANRRTGTKYAAKFGFDLKKMFADLEKRRQTRASANTPSRSRSTSRSRRAA